MRTAPITDNLIQLTRLRFVNAYMVREQDGLTLVDTMIPRSAAAIRAPQTPPVRRSAGSRSPTATVTTWGRWTH